MSQNLEISGFLTIAGKGAVEAQEFGWILVVFINKWLEADV
jgi:hypothetical protein